MNAALAAEIGKASESTRRVVAVGTGAFAVIFAGFALYILFALVSGALPGSAVVISLPIVIVGALWFGWIAVLAAKSLRKS